MISGKIYRDREQAGRELANRLRPLADQEPIVFGLVRGGVAVASPVAEELGAPLEPMIVRKVGHPRQPELAVGAIAPDGEVRVDPDVGWRFQVDLDELEKVIDRERAELSRRLVEFTGAKSHEVAGRLAIVVDDGLATGASAMVAGEYLRRKGSSRTILAIPVCPPEAAARMRSVYDEVLCLQEISAFRSVGQWYQDFRQLEDEDVKRILAEASER